MAPATGRRIAVIEPAGGIGPRRIVEARDLLPAAGLLRRLVLRQDLEAVGPRRGTAVVALCIGGVGYRDQPLPRAKRHGDAVLRRRARPDDGLGFRFAEAVDGEHHHLGLALPLPGTPAVIEQRELSLPRNHMRRPLALRHEVEKLWLGLVEIDMVAMRFGDQPCIEDAQRPGLVPCLHHDIAPAGHAGETGIGLRHVETVRDLAAVEIEDADDRLFMIGEDEPPAQRRMVMREGGGREQAAGEAEACEAELGGRHGRTPDKCNVISLPLSHLPLKPPSPSGG